MKQKSQEILGKTVVNEDGFVIGEVNDYLVDLETWTVSELQIKIERKKAKELGLKAPFFGNLLVLVEVDQIQSLTDQVILGLGADDFAPYIERRKQEAKNGGASDEEEDGEEG